MKRLLIVLLLLTLPAFAQFTARRVGGSGSLPATCSIGPPSDIWMVVTGGASTFYYCSAVNTWTASGGGVAASGSPVNHHLALWAGATSLKQDSACVTNDTGALSGCTSISTTGPLTSGTAPGGVTSAATAVWAATEGDCTTGLTPTLTTSWACWDAGTHALKFSFNGAANGPLNALSGGTGNAFFTVLGLTAARNITFPDAAITVARTDAGNTFTGHQTIEGVISTGATGTGKFVFDTAPTLSALTVGGTAVFGTSPPAVTAGTGGGMGCAEGTAPTGVASADLLYCDSTAHRWKVINNNGTAAQLLNSGVDINTSDQVTGSTVTLRSSGVLPYFKVQTPADTGVTASTAGPGVQLATATRTWATTGTVTDQCEVCLNGPTYASASASQTFTDTETMELTPPVQGTNAIFTRGHTLMVKDATSTSSAITGGLIVAATPGTAATSVGIGGGNINAGGTITSQGNTTTTLAATSTTALGSTGQYAVNASGLVTKDNNLTTAGMGHPITLGFTSQRAETTTADANVLTVTPASAVGSYCAHVVISVASATSGVISWTMSYADSNANAQTNIAQPLFQHGTAAPNTTFTTSAAGNYHGDSCIDISNAGTAIVIKWVGGGTTSAKMSAWIDRVN